MYLNLYCFSRRCELLRVEIDFYLCTTNKLETARDSLNAYVVVQNFDLFHAQPTSCFNSSVQQTNFNKVYPIRPVLLLVNNTIDLIDLIDLHKISSKNLKGVVLALIQNAT